MTTWESSDKLIKKEIIQKGSFSQKPTEMSACNVYIDNLKSVNLSVEQIKNYLHSEIIEAAGIQVIVIGHACSTVDRCIERAVQTMSLNEQSLTTIKVIPNDLAMEKIILTLELTLKSCEFYKPIWLWTEEEKYENAMKYKLKGVELFKAKRIVDAFYRFSKACKILITLEPLEDIDKPLEYKIVELKHILYNNMAECQLIRKNYDNAIALCCKVLAKEENNVKALYRRGVAYGNLRNYKKAIDDLKIVVYLEPNNSRALEKFNYYNEQWRSSVHAYEDMVRKMFKV
ncbi:FK506-binding protein-like [Phymastichus coffea]|uniref:FK506-binding protein-like n=1 Tax=Phymastichus coffea TaxID=108790 RepID=UPI00273CD142|nr:FK506-binding protein-like [Phymastichus coffea]